MYIIKGIINDTLSDFPYTPRKRLAIQFPASTTLREVDIDVSTKENPGQLRLAACAVLGIDMSEIKLSDHLKRIVGG